MAKYVICTIADKAVGAYMQPFFAKSVGEARRSFGDAVLDPKMEFGRHPEDYSLYQIGTWDDSGEYLVLKEFELLARAIDFNPVS